MRGENDFQGNAPFPLDLVLCSVQIWAEREGIESFSMKSAFLCRNCVGWNEHQ
jgi:hypothetical protein